ncbi:hypothetical protein [Hydrogenophaga crassostreae]|uniref:hypothetical protein n=1 Tax=Hydrogenophaga crassostreae TaxID=1763535 RepID=UPI000A9ADA30|nr:hypothetical protein [Hydrogenophaga crassostreae]
MQNNEGEIGKRGFSPFLDRILLIFSAIGTALILSKVLHFGKYGFDFTDEGFYLNWIANPFMYDASISQFGFLYHPLYIAFSEDVASLRRANVLITFLIAWWLAFSTLRSLNKGHSEEVFSLHVLASGLATSSLIYFDNWLLTPSYNSLTLQALMIAAIGLILVCTPGYSDGVVGWVLIGIGGCLSFVAKPSTALILGLFLGIYFVATKRSSFLKMGVSVLAAILLFGIISVVIDGSIPAFIDRLYLGFELSQLLGSGHGISNLFRLDDINISKRELAHFLVITLASFASIRLGCSNSGNWRAISIIFLIPFLYTSLKLGFGVPPKIIDTLALHDLVIWSIVLSIIFSGVAASGKAISFATFSSQLGIAFIFLTMPFFYAFGTGNNYWSSGSSASIFWLIGSLVSLGSLAKSKPASSFLLPVVLSVQALVALMLHQGMERPYRQNQPLSENQSVTELGRSKSKLILSSEYSNYIESAKNLAHQGGFEINTPFIDLTGQSPGISFALGGVSLGQAWFIGGYPGSVDLANASLDRVPCSMIADAWLLLEPNGPNSIPIEVVNRQGYRFPEGYVEKGALLPPGWIGSSAITRHQILYSPDPLSKRNSLETCLLKRREERN